MRSASQMAHVLPLGSRAVMQTLDVTSDNVKRVQGVPQVISLVLIFVLPTRVY